MATSINESVNWRQTAVSPDYKVGSTRVDTFVQGQRNTKGEQVAAALESAAGTVGGLARSMKVEQVREQTKEEKQQEALDRLRADNQSASQRELASQWLEDTDISTYATPEDALDQYSEDTPTYGEALNTLTTDVGKIRFGTEFGDVWNQKFYEKKKSQKDFETAETLNENFMTELNRDGQTDQAMPVDDPRFTNLVKSLETKASELGYETPQSQYELLASVAEQQYREGKDARLFDYLQGNVKGRTAIGGTDFQNTLATKKESIRKLHLSQDNEMRLAKERELKENKVKLAQKTSSILNGDEEGDLLELADEYMEMGVPNALQTVKAMQDAYDDLDDVNLDSTQYSEIWQGFLNVNTPMEQVSYLNNLVEKDSISKPLLAQLYSRIGNNNDKAMFDNSLAWQSIKSGVSALSKDKDSGFALAEYTYLDGVAKQLWIEQVTSPDWQDKPMQERMAVANTILSTLNQLKGQDNNEYRIDALPDAQKIFNKLSNPDLEEPREGETPAEATERLIKLKEQQEQL